MRLKLFDGTENLAKREGKAARKVVSPIIMPEMKTRHICPIRRYQVCSFR